MDDLPELPFEQVLSYLNLEDRLKARAVSRSWRKKFDCYPVKTLCCSERPLGFIWEKNRWVSGTFAQNFISTTRFTTFFDAYGRSILSSLKHLRFCGLDLTEGGTTAFGRTLNSFGQLEELDIIRAKFEPQRQFNLNLPMLNSLQLEKVRGIKKLTLDAPRLQEVTIRDSFQTGLRVKIVHGESVERLLVDDWECTEVKKLKNLQFLYVHYLPRDDSTFLSSLQQLKEIYTNDPYVSELFEQKQQSDRADLKIYLCGLLLNRPDDPAINAFRHSFPSFLNGEWFVCLAENLSRLADEIPLYEELRYSAIESITPSLEVDLLKRCTHLKAVKVYDPVADTQRFLDLLKNCKNLVEIMFDCAQPQDLFNRLPEHSAVQWLHVYPRPSDQAFLFRLKHLIHLEIVWAIDIETVRRAFDELPVLSSFEFTYGLKRASIRIGQSKQFQVTVGYTMKKWTVSNLNAAIEFIVANQ